MIIVIIVYFGFLMLRSSSSFTWFRHHLRSAKSITVVQWLTLLKALRFRNWKDNVESAPDFVVSTRKIRDRRLLENTGKNRRHLRSMENVGLPLDREHRRKPTDPLRSGGGREERRNDPRAGVDQIGLEVEHQPPARDTVDLKLSHQSTFRT